MCDPVTAILGAVSMVSSLAMAPSAPDVIQAPPPPAPAPVPAPPPVPIDTGSVDASLQVDIEAAKARSIKRAQSNQTQNSTLLGTDPGTTISTKTLLGQ